MTPIVGLMTWLGARLTPSERQLLGGVAAAWLFGLAAGWATAFAAQSPVLIQAMAGLALIGAFAGALAGTVAEVQDREAAVLCFVVTASGTAFFGISAPFWGLAVGGLVMLATRLRR